MPSSPTWLEMLGQEVELLNRMAYTAGLVDGEGCICVEKGRPVVQVRMCDHQGPEFLHEHWGGQLRLEASPEPNSRASMRWRAQGDSARVFLSDVAPWLMVKRQQADLAIELAGVPASQPDYRTFLADNIRHLNKRGM